MLRDHLFEAPSLFPASQISVASSLAEALKWRCCRSTSIAQAGAPTIVVSTTNWLDYHVKDVQHDER